MIWGDTIVAISSAVGPAARMIVRASGPEAISLARRLTGAAAFESGSALRARVSMRELSFPAFIYVFRGPRSYTGEDLVEFHVPGNPVLARMLLGELMRLGARSAEAGEFTARAYFNGRLDLTAAEGVAATIGAHSEQELSAARQLLAGELARRLAPIMDLLAQTLALVEVGIDFVEEDVAFLSAGEVEHRINEADAALDRLLRESSRFEKISHEPQVVLVGRPNAGKSTLLNALAGRERAVISPVAGTTRDVLWADVPLSRGTIRLIDVAGIDGETGPSDTDPAIESQMRARALQSLDVSDVVVLVRDLADSRPPLVLSRAPSLTVLTKHDLQSTEIQPNPDQIVVSARTGFGLNELRDRLDALSFGETSAAPALALNVRHVAQVNEAREALRLARERATDGPELLALELRESLDALGQVLGHVSPDELLGRIFSSFCIGK